MQTNNRMHLTVKRVRLLCVVLTAFAAGCVPIPTQTIKNPNIKGKLLANEQPLSGYTLHFSYSIANTCTSDESEFSTTTNKKGEFIIPSKNGLSFFRMAVPAGSVQVYSICFVSPSGEKRWAYQTHIRTHEWAPDESLICDFNALHQNAIRQTMSVFGFKASCSDAQ